jgi:nitroimidazol reductase NimA-like FMN-containing flavoprotein (pyridoxamine 5'-phosphate oxidase superfamily)
MLETVATFARGVGARQLEELDRAGCVALLRSRAVGRVAVSVQALPAVMPVAFAVGDDHLVFRAATGSPLDAATADAVVAFQVDHVGERTGECWSVLVVGRCSAVRDDSVVVAGAVPVMPWEDPAASHYVRLPLQLVTGWRFRR